MYVNSGLVLEVRLVREKQKNGMTAFYCEIYYSRTKRPRERCIFKGIKLFAELEGHQKLAERFVEEKERDLKFDGLSVNQILNNEIPFSKFAERIKNSKENENTRKVYNQAIKNFLECFGDINFKEITLLKISDFKEFLIKKGYAENTRHNHVKYIRAIYKDANDEGLVRDFKKPFKGLTTPRETLPIYLDIDELKAIYGLNLDEYIKTMHPRHQKDTKIKEARVWFLVMCYLGLRVGDMKSFNDSVDIKNKNISRVHQKTGRIYNIPLNKTVLNLIKEYDNKLPPISEQRLRSNLKTLAKLAGINKNFTPHSAKHTFISLLANNDVNIDTIASLLNQSVKVIRRVYLHVYEKSKIEAINKLPEL